MEVYDNAIEKLNQIGSENMNNDELIRAFLGCFVKGKTLNEYNQCFWEKTGDLSGYLLLNRQEKTQLFSQNSAACRALELGIEVGRRIQQQPVHVLGKVLGSAQIGELMVTRFQKQPQEHLLLLCLDTKNQIKQEVVVFKGGLNSAEVHPREIMQEVLRVSSNSFMLVHNHPSGNASPSQNDLNFTHKMRKIGELMGISLLDHIIVGDQFYWSAAEKRMLND